MGPGKEILIVEDDEEQAQEQRRLLLENGYSVRVARNGAEGLDAIKERAPAVVISDIVMPVMDGYEMCRRVKDDRAFRGIPFILLTTLTDTEDIIKGLNAEADSYVTKPYEPGYLLKRVTALIETPTQYRNNPDEKSVEIFYNGKAYSIRSGRGQALSLLLSTYENAILQNRELNRTQEELKALNDLLEEKVRERTAELTAEVSERKKAEAAQKEGEKRLGSIVETASDAIICMDERGLVYLWNRKAEEMFGYAASEILGRYMHDYIVPERLRERAKAAITAFLSTGRGPVIGKTIEIEGLNKDGTEFPVEVSVSAMNIKGRWHSTGIIRDITARKAAEERLRQKIEELERFKSATIKRELRMKELRVKIEKLEKRK
ncbi:MAG: PAS domain S-box protein [Deltaproteobacteria bacterium]|nr:PAS domain S-box protein [Deltaproteobacteria bacterium]